ncbi:MAG: sulfatase-like hydrolase/transferase [Candidatus Nanopelagicales bacterium]|jgi:arylsulfatase A-like enzyme|nr:sulfatase-like hydrolase/transferase [Candidatus Nanopelagicales bacterium]
MHRRYWTPVAALVALATLTGTANAEPDTGPTFTQIKSEQAGNTAQALPDTPGPGPNVVVIITDDQAKGTLDAMPNVRNLIRDRGVTLETGIIPTSLCCPSRTALLSGKLSHTTGVYENLGPNGGWSTFNSSGAENNTIATALDAAGYRTAMLGKYLNGYALADPAYVPPGWDTFRAIQDDTGNPALAAGAYFNYTLHGTGPDQFYGTRAADYSTDVLTDLAVDFIQTTPTDQPFLLYYSTSGGHAPFTPAPRHAGTWQPENLPPSVTQLTSQRPSFWPDDTLPYGVQQERLRQQHEALRSVDDGVGRIVNALGNRASNTLFVYLSDNGLQFGEHGLANKNVPYAGSTEVPMMLRWNNRILPGTTYTKPVTNVDLTATIADATGVAMNGEGVSYFAANRPNGVLLEATASDEHPAYCGWRTERWLFVEYDNVNRRELYDYDNDPNELTNKAPDNQTRVDELRALAQNACTPTPPGFTW